MRLTTTKRTAPAGFRPRLAPSGELQDELRALIAERESARAAGDYAKSDAIRDRLRDAGIDVLDSASGTTWVRRRVT